MKKLMILGASILQTPAIEKAKEMGLSVVAVDVNPDAVGFQMAGIKQEVISTIDIPKVLAAARQHEIDGIMTLASDMPMRTIAAVAKELGLKGITEDCAWKATNKVAMRDALAEHKVPIPMYVRASDLSSFMDAVHEMKSRGIRCIIKPADNSGSRGICLVENDSELNLREIYRYSKSFSHDGDLLVEEFMEGPEVSVETLSIDGECHVIQITDKLTTGSPYFVEMGHSQPSMLPFDIQELIKKIAVAANRAIGIMDGPSHTEIKVTKNGPKIVELGARLGGDNITTHLVPLSTGVDMVKCCIQIALGEEPDYISKLRGASAIRYIQTQKGIIEKIDGLENAKKIAGVQQVNIVHGVGEQIDEIRNSIDRLGYVITKADTPKLAIEICEEALQEIKVKIRT